MKRLLLAAAAAALPFSAWAQEPGWYADLAGSYVILQDADLVDGRLPGSRGELGADDGFGVTGALGYRYGNGVRAELELGYRENDLDSVALGAFGTALTGPVGGDVSALSGMVNVLYDYRVNGGVVPYVGGGIGAADVSVDSAALAVDEGDTVFAYQFMGGLGYPLTERLSVRLGYRFFATTDPDIQGTEGEYASHNVEAGLTVSF